MLTQSENIVRIEGILSEININEREFINKQGVRTPCLSGSITVRCDFKHKDEEYQVDIPISVFAARTTSTGKINPAYRSVEEVKNTFVSIAASNEERADRIRITNGSLSENSFFSENSNRIINGIRISANFINKIRKDECNPCALFHETMVIGNMTDEVDSEGVETGALKIKGIIIQYGEKADVVDFIVRDPAAVSYIRSHWNERDTVAVDGIINFSSKTEYTTGAEEVGFGEPTKIARTVTVRELILTSGSVGGLGGAYDYDENELSQALAVRKARLEDLKNQPKKMNPKPAAPARATSAASSLNDLDF